jgi:hypothetical protein
VNQDSLGSVDFEKMSGIEGVGLINIVSNPQDAAITSRKEIQTKITYNDGGSWHFLTPPKYDSNGQEYGCRHSQCHLHLHSHPKQYNPSATYSTPAIPGMVMGIGNVGERLANYDDSSMFYSRDAGVTWEELNEDPHIWQFGDHGSILVAANDERPTNEVIYSEDEGLSWKKYQFSDEKMRVRKISTSSDYQTRKFLLLCESRHGLNVAVYLDFSSVTKRKCQCISQRLCSADPDPYSQANGTRSTLPLMTWNFGLRAVQIRGVTAACLVEK